MIVFRSRRLPINEEGLLKSIKILEEDKIYLHDNPQAQLALAGWLMEAGRSREAAELFNDLEVISAKSAHWRMAKSCRDSRDGSTGNYVRCIELWQAMMNTNAIGQLPPVMFSLPFATLNPTGCLIRTPGAEINLTAMLPSRAFEIGRFGDLVPDCTGTNGTRSKRRGKNVDEVTRWN